MMNAKREMKITMQESKRSTPERTCSVSTFIIYHSAFIILFSGCNGFGKDENSPLSPVSVVKVKERNVEVRLAKGGLGSAGGLTNHGITYALNGNWNEAVDTWKRALEADPDCHAAHFNLGQAYAIQGMHRWAHAAMSRAAQLDDDPLYRDGLRLVEVAMRPPRTPVATAAQPVAWPAPR
jgi:tetratricopeptide (TPR) repeat protein